MLLQKSPLPLSNSQRSNHYSSPPALSNETQEPECMISGTIKQDMTKKRNSSLDDQDSFKQLRPFSPTHAMQAANLQKHRESTPG